MKLTQLFLLYTVISITAPVRNHLGAEKLHLTATGNNGSIVEYNLQTPLPSNLCPPFLIFFLIKMKFQKDYEK